MRFRVIRAHVNERGEAAKVVCDETNNSPADAAARRVNVTLESFPARFLIGMAEPSGQLYFGTLEQAQLFDDDQIAVILPIVQKGAPDAEAIEVTATLDRESLVALRDACDTLLAEAEPEPDAPEGT